MGGGTRCSSIYEFRKSDGDRIRRVSTSYRSIFFCKGGNCPVTGHLCDDACSRHNREFLVSMVLGYNLAGQYKMVFHHLCIPERVHIAGIQIRSNQERVLLSLVHVTVQQPALRVMSRRIISISLRVELDCCNPAFLLDNCVQALALFCRKQF